MELAQPDLVWLDLKRLGRQWSLWDDVWDVRCQFRRRDILAAIEARAFCVESYATATQPWTWERHVQRIAYLSVHGWADPVSVDVGIPVLNFFPDWPIQDGNHRLKAALFRRDRAILASVAGQVSEIERFTYRKALR